MKSQQNYIIQKNSQFKAVTRQKNYNNYSRRDQTSKAAGFYTETKYTSNIYLLDRPARRSGTSLSPQSIHKCSCCPIHRHLMLSVEACGRKQEFISSLKLLIPDEKDVLLLLLAKLFDLAISGRISLLSPLELDRLTS